MPESIAIAYFSMEIALESAIPTYAGGLGILAGDTLRSAADDEISMAGITLLSRKGYFRQIIDNTGWQSEEPVVWPVDDYLLPVDVRVNVGIENRQVYVRAWRYDIVGTGGFTVPVYLLDTDIDGNSDYDRTLTDQLYGGDSYYRLCQEVILGIGGVRMLRELGYRNIERFHMNEGHSSLLVFELMSELKLLNPEATISELTDTVRRSCVFTTHTPVEAGHDRFPMSLAYRVLKQCNPFKECSEIACCDNVLNLTHLALEGSYYINGVAKKHGEISRKMFEGYHIDSITNGIHVYTWACDPVRELFDRHIPDWRTDNASLRYAASFSDEDIWEAHLAAKRKLIEYVNKTSNAGMDQSVMTIGFARRATPYKRTTLIFSDTEKLKRIVDHAGPLQLIFSGKAHPNDIQGKELIQEIYKVKDGLGSKLRIVYLSDYDMDIARLLVSGSDLWLNTPLPPLEASGTSGMKAAINGVPSISILDGWWIEGCIEGVTGWAIANSHRQSPHDLGEMDGESDILYSKLENIVVPMFYHQRKSYINVMRSTIAINGSFFNTQRMLDQYVAKAYFR